MALFIDAQILDSLTRYDGLLKAIALWLERDDLADEIPYFVQLAEARFRRLLTNPELETEITVAAGCPVTLPDDFEALRLLYPAGGRRDRAFLQLSPDVFQQGKHQNKSVFTLMAGQLWISPLPETETAFSLVYRAALPSLSLNRQSNWLLASHPDIYLFGSLLQAEFFGWNDSRLPVIKSALDEALGELNKAGLRKRYAESTLVAPSPVVEAVKGTYRW